MKRILAGLATACAATLMTAAPAQAAPVDPVKALKKQFVTGKGVRVSEDSVTKIDGKTTTKEKTTIRVAFGKSGVAAADLTSKGNGASTLSPDRMISVGGYTYVQGGVFDTEMPEGKKWVRYPGVASGASTNQVLDIFQPKVLRTLVGKAKSVKGGTYKGAMTYKEVAKLYGDNSVKGPLGNIKVTYALTLNGKGLATRLVTGLALDFGMLGKTTSTTDTRFSSWGAKTTIKAPPKSQWVDAKDLGGDGEIPEELPDVPPLINQRKLVPSAPLGH
jgi:hypothetical protein